MLFKCIFFYFNPIPFILLNEIINNFLFMPFPLSKWALRALFDLTIQNQECAYDVLQVAQLVGKPTFTGAFILWCKTLQLLKIHGIWLVMQTSFPFPWSVSVTIYFFCKNVFLVHYVFLCFLSAYSMVFFVVFQQWKK